LIFSVSTAFFSEFSEFMSWAKSASSMSSVITAQRLAAQSVLGQ